MSNVHFRYIIKSSEYKNITRYAEICNYKSILLQFYFKEIQFYKFRIHQQYFFLRNVFFNAAHLHFLSSVFISWSIKMGERKNYNCVWPHPYILLLCANYSFIIVAIYFLNETYYTYTWHWWHLRRCFILQFVQEW